MEVQETMVRKILKNEFAQLMSVLVAIWFFVTNVILPLNSMQSSLANIQLTLLDIKSTNTDFNNRITENSNNIIRLQASLAKYNIIIK